MDFSGDFQPPRIDPAIRDAANAASNFNSQVPFLPKSSAAEYQPGREGEGRLDAWVQALLEVLRSEMPRVVLDSSHQGSGKSYAVPDLADAWVYTDDFNPGEISYRYRDNGNTAEIQRIDSSHNGVFYVNRNFRSPSIDSITAQFQEIPTRHQGLISVPGPDGNPITRTITAQEIKDGIQPDELATCKYAHRLHALSSRGFSYKDATESFCKDRCPYRPPTRDKDSGAVIDGGDGSCIHRQATSAFWCGYEGASEPVPSSPFIRCSIQALEGLISLCPEYLKNSLIFFDESDQLFDAAIKTHNLSKKKLGDLLSFIPAQFMVRCPVREDLVTSIEKETNETAQKLTEQLLTQLLQLLTQIKTPHGIDHHQVRHHLQPWIDQVVETYGRSNQINLPPQWRIGSDSHLTQADDFERAITAEQPDSLDELPSPLLPLLVHCVLGSNAGPEFTNYSLNVTKSRSGSEGSKSDNYRITLASPSGLLPAIAEHSAAVLVGDATADPELIQQMFTKPEGCIAFKHVKAAPVQKSDQADAQFYQIKDLGAMTARERREHQTRRLTALRSAIGPWAAQILGIKEPKVGFIDHKRCALPGDGKWFTASARGGNMFQDHDVLALIGKPITNVSAALSSYVSLTGDTTASTGCSPEENSPAFIRYQSQLIAAELQQAWERLRIIRRKGKRLIVLFISDADLSGLPIDVTQIKAETITPQAAHKTDQKLMAITQAIAEIAAEGLPPERISTRKVAKASGVAESSVRRIAQHQNEGGSWLEFVAGILAP